MSIFDASITRIVCCLPTVGSNYLDLLNNKIVDDMVESTTMPLTNYRHSSNVPKVLVS